MNNISKFDYCYGCSVCASVCHKKAISMQLDQEGFFKPIVDEALCVDCGLCRKVCSFHATEVMQDNSAPIASYAVWSNAPQIRYRCTSGGVGFEMGRFLIGKGYKAIVCKYNPKTRHAEHYVAETEKELEASIGSKYIQSDAIHGFSKIEKGQKYFISGTPCQIDSIRRWVRRNKMEDDVVLMDFFCHGVPSYLLWKKYLEYVESKVGNVDNITWRNKDTGWQDSTTIKCGEHYISSASNGDLFYKMFLGDCCLGRQCYNDCNYKYNHSAADIRVGDLWGPTYCHNKKGVSGLVCFTSKGQSVLNEMDSILHIEESSLNIVAEDQFKECPKPPLSYNYVKACLKTDTPLSVIVRKASRMDLITEIPDKINYYIKRLPSKIKEVIGYKNSAQ